MIADHLAHDLAIDHSGLFGPFDLTIDHNRIDEDAVTFLSGVGKTIDRNVDKAILLCNVADRSSSILRNRDLIRFYERTITTIALQNEVNALVPSTVRTLHHYGLVTVQRSGLVNQCVVCRITEGSGTVCCGILVNAPCSIGINPVNGKFAGIKGGRFYIFDILVFTRIGNRTEEDRSGATCPEVTTRGFNGELNIVTLTNLNILQLGRRCVCQNVTKRRAGGSRFLDRPCTLAVYINGIGKCARTRRCRVSQAINRDGYNARLFCCVAHSSGGSRAKRDLTDLIKVVCIKAAQKEMSAHTTSSSSIRCPKTNLPACDLPVAGLRIEELAVTFRTEDSLAVYLIVVVNAPCRIRIYAAAVRKCVYIKGGGVILFLVRNRTIEDGTCALPQQALAPVIDLHRELDKVALDNLNASCNQSIGKNIPLYRAVGARNLGRPLGLAVDHDRVSKGTIAGLSGVGKTVDIDVDDTRLFSRVANGSSRIA